MEKADKRSFVKGAAILGIAGLICKVIGAFFRIPLYNMLGDGMQYYEAVYPFYSTLLVISSAGLPTAISRMVAERVTLGDYYGARRVFRKAMLLLLGIGAATTALMFFGADYLAASTVGTGAAMSFRALAPALLIVSLMCAYRGYLQGMQRMTGTALSQVVEQVGKLGFGLY
ncbi:MAG: oligosaccharide flippase family protein, partial [Clostridia bacterium]|nr:oligosaccharide flippase family protein [Clostridia bacterium]